MAAEKAKKPEKEHHVPASVRSIERMLFLDLLDDPQARPVLIYALLVLIAASLLYSWLEGWSLLDSFYFAVISTATIGYGDFVPTRPVTKVLTIFMALNGVAVLLMLFDQIQRIRSRELEDTVEDEEESGTSASS